MEGKRWLFTSEVGFITTAFGSTVDVIGDLRRKPHSPPPEESRQWQWPKPKNEEVFFRERSPVLGEFSKRFFEWVKNQSTLKQKSKDYYANGWRLLADTDVVSMRLDAICQDDTERAQFSRWPVEPQQCTSHASANARQSGRVESA